MVSSPTRGRSEYRDNATLRCPACGAVMLAQAIEQAIIDVCDECGGVWADAEDGNIATIATQARVPEHVDEVTAELPTTCPRCARRLAPWTADNVTLDRCRRCGGTFIPRVAIDAAMWLLPDAGEPPPTGLEGLAGWVKRILGRG